MLYQACLFGAMILGVELPMTLECHNKEAVDLANELNVDGHTHHVGVRHNLLHKLKEQGILITKLISGAEK